MSRRGLYTQNYPDSQPGFSQVWIRETEYYGAGGMDEV